MPVIVLQFNFRKDTDFLATRLKFRKEWNDFNIENSACRKLNYPMLPKIDVWKLSTAIL